MRHPPFFPEHVRRSSGEYTSSSYKHELSTLRRFRPVACSSRRVHECAIDGRGYGGTGLDSVHSEDISLVQIGKNEYRMYYATCDKDGNWRIASAVTKEPDQEINTDLANLTQTTNTQPERERR